MKTIVFAKKNVAEIWDMEKKVPDSNEVCVKMHYSAISAGTERANLTGDPHVNAKNPISSYSFPRFGGYSGSGIIESVGKEVDDLKAGDRVVAYFGRHQEYNTLPSEHVVKIEDDNISLRDAAFIFISTFSLAAVRKVKLELGESCMVVGLGILGLFAVQFARLSGALPIIAVDFNEKRRDMAIKLGADAALDPSDENYHKKIMDLTNGKGVNSIIEVTGNGAALNSALPCAAKYGRVALLGCTRKETSIDFYHHVHYPGVNIIGAHTLARPQYESFPGYWTHTDDCRTVLGYLKVGRFNISDIISEVHTPEDAPEVYSRLAFDKNFPVGIVFDWT